MQPVSKWENCFYAILFKNHDIFKKKIVRSLNIYHLSKNVFIISTISKIFNILSKEPDVTVLVTKVMEEHNFSKINKVRLIG